MLKSIFGKTIYEQRWSMLLWAVGVAAMALVMMGFYHSFQAGGFDQILKSVPKSLQGIVGNLNSFKTVPGYVSQEAFALRIPMLTLIMGIILFTGLLAGDEKQGTLQSLLVQPVARWRILLEKYLAGLVISFIVCTGAIVGILLGLLLIHEQMSLLRLVQAVIGVWLLTVVFGTVGFSLGAVTGKRGLAGSVAGLITFSTYMLTSFVGSVPSIATIEKLSPFHYYNQPAITEVGLKGTNTIIMLLVTGLLLLIALVIFQKRDIYQR